jgi:Tol biopolymer transport system component/DNA-binding winged helix-turn-helix (wHTH) protein
MNASPHVFNKHPLDTVSVPSNLRLRVGDHVVDLGALRVITQPNAPRLTSKAAAVLIELARHAGDTVTRDELLDRVWKDRVTTPDVLTQAIKELRRAFADDARPPRYIETIPKVGYRLLAAVSVVPVAPVSVAQDGHGFDDAANTDDIVQDDPRAAIAGAAIPDFATPATAARAPWWFALVALALVLIAAGVVAIVKRNPSAVAAGGWQVTDVRAITSDPGPERRPRISPDGTRVAYSQMDPVTKFERIVVRSVDQSKGIHLTTRVTAHEEAPTWSPDGTRIAFERLGKDEACTLFVVPSMGGAESEVGPCGDFMVNYFDWSPDSKSLITSDQASAAAGNGLPLALLDLATGKKQVLRYPHAAADADLDPHFSPDGRWIAFRRGVIPHSDIFLMPAAGGDARQLTHLDASIFGYGWTPDSGALVISTNPQGKDALYVTRIDDGHVTGLDVPGPATYPDIARSGGNAVYEIRRTKNTLVQIAIDPQAAQLSPTPQVPQLIAASTGSDTAPTVSPDGKQIAFVSNRNGSEQVWLCAADGSDATALTDFRDAVVWNPHWSADGRRLLATVRRAGTTSLAQIELASRRHQMVAVSQNALLAGNYGPDAGSYLLIRRAADARGELILLRNADSAQEQVIPLASSVEHVELDAAARMIYYTKSDGQGVFRRDLAGGAEQAVTRNVTAAVARGWRLVDGRIWYVSAMMMEPFDLREFDPASGNDRVLAHVKGWLRDVNFSVTPLHDRVVFAPMGPEDSDVGAFKLTATGTR